MTHPHEMGARNKTTNSATLPVFISSRPSCPVPILSIVILFFPLFFLFKIFIIVKIFRWKDIKWIGREIGENMVSMF